MERILTQAEAIREATWQEMSRNPSVIVVGEGVDDPVITYGTTAGLADEFGSKRVFDTPLSEDAMTGIVIGASLGGLRPIQFHQRMDFLLLAMNQIVNIAAKSRYMFGGSVSIPIVIRSVIGRSWGQGAQHSQGLYPLFMNISGLRVVAPSSPYDAKGCMIQSIRDDDPVVFVEHRMLHGLKGHVPEDDYTVPFGQARVLAEGIDVTLVGVSYMAVECLRAKSMLEKIGIKAEVIDPVSLTPLDSHTIAESVKKTGHLMVVDSAWTMCGAGAEIITQMFERLQGTREIRVGRMGFEPVPCPTTKILENQFYPDAQKISSAVYSLLHGGSASWTPAHTEASEIVEFRGPF